MRLLGKVVSSPFLTSWLSVSPTTYSVHSVYQVIAIIPPSMSGQNETLGIRLSL